eukprot:scaffold4044_cov399-Prasinococcus_capsulatus_cf.AAC.16
MLREGARMMMMWMMMSFAPPRRHHPRFAAARRAALPRPIPCRACAGLPPTAASANGLKQPRPSCLPAHPGPSIRLQPR